MTHAHTRGNTRKYKYHVSSLFLALTVALATQEVWIHIRIHQNEQLDVMIFTPSRYTPPYGSTEHALFAAVRNPGAIFVYSDLTSSVRHVCGEENKVTLVLKIENVFFTAL
jgi:hypothetical protein